MKSTPPARQSRTGRVAPVLAAIAGFGLLVASGYQVWTSEGPAGAGRAPAAALASSSQARPSPFSIGSPAAAAFDPGSALSGVTLIGLRSAPAPEPGGAVFLMSDGQERAFTIGQYVAPGARLAAVRADDVLIELAGAAPIALPLEWNARSGSFPKAVGPDAGAWLTPLLAPPEDAVGAPIGWRVREAAPAFAAEAGLRPGDLIVSVNGASPPLAALQRAALERADEVRMEVRRGDGDTLSVTVRPPRRLATRM